MHRICNSLELANVGAEGWRFLEWPCSAALSCSCSYSNGSSWKTSTSVRRSLLWKCTIPAGEAGEGMIAVGWIFSQDWLLVICPSAWGWEVSVHWWQCRTAGTLGTSSPSLPWHRCRGWGRELTLSWFSVPSLPGKKSLCPGWISYS